MAETFRYTLLQQGQSFCFETVFSHPSKIDFVANARALGYQVIVVYIHLASSGLYRARVAQRVSEGGHNVPDEKVNSRLPRTLANIARVIPLCNQFWALDNSSIHNPLQPVLVIKEGVRVDHVTPEPAWVSVLVNTAGN